MLEQDICLYSNEIDLVERVLLSSGGEYCSTIESYTQYPYIGFIPKKPWRSLTSEESCYLITNSPPKQYFNSIYLGKLPNEIYRLAGALSINARDPQRHMEENQFNSKYFMFESAIGNYFSSIYLKQEGIKFLPIYCGIKGLPTTTFSTDKKEFIGLHIDSWDSLTWNDRTALRNRICINLGIEARYFLFINLQAITIIKKLQQINIHEFKRMGGPDGEFMYHFPHYPVVKLKIEPGEYYVAPTENMIHDGCTEDKTYNDVLLSMLGYFSTSGITNKVDVVFSRG